MNNREIDQVLELSQKAFASWRNAPAHERADVLRTAETRLRERREEFASLIVEEAGKPLKLARVEVDRALGVLDWAAAEAVRFGGEWLRLDAARSGRQGFGIHERFPRGPVLGITPFNFPLNLVLHKVAPAVACGCPIVIKPSPFVSRTARAVETLFEGAPEGLVQVVLASDEATARMTTDARIATISFTGSARVGWTIRRQAPEKPATLELGGNAWVIVTEDLSPEKYEAVAKRIAGAAFGYAGQSCISVQNVAVSSKIWRDFMPALREATRSIVWGDPSLEYVVCGPVISDQAGERLEGKLTDVASRLSADAVTLAGEPTGKASGPRFVRPRLIEIAYGAPVDDLISEELFGPAMTAMPYKDLRDVISAVNAGPYGLQAGVFSDRLGTAETLFRELRVGGLVVNDVPSARYDHQPYGGVKQSGQGREGVRYAMEEMSESKFLALSSEIPG